MNKKTVVGESVTQSKVIKDVNGFGKYVFSYKVIKANTVGIPDFFFATVLTGPILIEFKKEGKEPRDSQDKQMGNAERVGIRCFVIDSVRGWVALKKHLGLNIENLVKAGLKDDCNNRMAFTEDELK